MSEKKSLKSYIDELIQEVEKELDESNVTGNIDGYQTPHAFSGKDSKKRREKTATQLGYSIVDNDVENIDESILTEKQFKGLEGIPSNVSLEKATTTQKLNIIKAPGNIIDFIVPNWAKKSRNFWQVISTGKVKKNSTGNHYLEGKIIPSPAFDSLDDLIKGIDWKSMEKRRRFNESVNEAKTYKKGDKLKIKLPNGKKFDVVFDMYARTKGVALGKFKDGSGEYDIKPFNLNTIVESVNENRWLELKNDTSMHANKKLAVGLKELKYQLMEVEKFFTWYNRIKNINELDSQNYWKRTNGHIYKIKERLVNIAKTLKEIEK